MTTLSVLTLVGLMGAGKSTVAQCLAGRWGFEARDLDNVIAERAGATVAMLFDNLGESGFRELERACLEDVLREEGVVIATGGGAVCSHAAAALVDEAGPSVFLTGDTSVLAQRAWSEGGRPLLDGCVTAKDAEAVLKTQLTTRHAWYARATFTVAVDRHTPEMVADRIEQALTTRGWSP